MKIGILSDSHDHLPNLKKIMVEFKRLGADLVIHAGDFIAPFTINPMKLAGCPVYAVFGNNDGEIQGLSTRFKEIGEVHREPHLFNFNGFRIALMHEPLWVDTFAKKEIADMVVYGHMHDLLIENRPPWIINPGEVFGGLSGKPTAIWFDTEIGAPEILFIDDLPEYTE